MFRHLFAALVVVGTLAGCATNKYVTSDVTRFHTLAASLSGKTFAIVAVGAEQEQSLAFHQFGDIINGRLSALGMKQYAGTDGPQNADHVVTLEYGIFGPSPDVRTYGYGGPRIGMSYGYSGRHWGYGLAYDPFWNDDNYVDTRQMFVRRVELYLYRGATYSSNRKERVFEGRAVSTGLNGQIEPVMPYMLDAIFKDFPGPSGQTVTVSVQVPPDVEQAGSKASTRPSSRSSY